MRLKIKYLLGGLFLSIVGSCTLETSNNGDLDGYWKLCSVDTLATGGRLDFTERSIFWSVQKDLLTVRDNTNPQEEYIFRFQQTADSLILKEAKGYDKAHGDTLVTHPIVLHQFGINATEEHFKIHQLSSRYMQLSNDNFHLRFRKF